MKLIGLTGGIGAGKSTVAAMFAELGAHILDADVMARRAVEPGSPALALLVGHFGPGIVDSHGELNRSRLASLVFSDPDERAFLEAVVHPEVHKLTEKEIEYWRTKDPDGVIIYDIPLLAESRNSYDFDHVVVAHAPTDVRKERLVTLRNMSANEADARIAAQATDADRLALADIVINTGGSLEDTYAQVESAWRSFASA